MSNHRPPARRGPMGHGPRIAEKPKDFKKALGKLIGFIKPFLVPVIIALVFAVAGTVLNLLGPNKISDLTNIISGAFKFDAQTMQWLSFDLDMKAVISACVLLLSLYTAGLLCSYVQGLIMTTVTHKNSQKMRAAISEKINLLPLKYFDGNSTGDILSRVTNDVDTIGQTLNQSIVTLFTSVVMLVGCIIMMFITNALMAVTAIVSSLAGIIIMFMIMGKSQKYFARQQTYLGELNGHIEEVYSGHNVVKAYNAERIVQNEFNSINKNLYNSAWKSQFLSGLMMPLMNFIGNLGYVAVCVVGALLVANGKIQFGVVTAFMLYVRLFTSPLSQLAQAFTSMQSAAAASERVFEFLGEEELSNESEKTKKTQSFGG